MVTGGRSSGRGRTAVVAVVLLAVAVVVFLIQGEYVARTEVVDAVQRSDDEVVLTVATCQGDPTVEAVNQLADEVRVDVRSTHYLWGSGDCQDQVAIELSDPLGDRDLVDVETGEVVEVSPAGDDAG